MENSARALITAFSMMMFVIGFTYSIFLINKLLSTSSVLLDSVETTKYYDNIEVKDTSNTTRIVGVETIVPVLYRYYKENYSVRILDNNDYLIQLFDLGIESKMQGAANYIGTDEKEKAALANSIYNDGNNSAYMFGAPWAGSLDNAKIRVDYFLNGTKGYINNTLVDYSKNGGFLKKYGNGSFEESFVEYAYKGETISTENGLETITGSTQESNKIIITYKLINN